SSTRVPLGKGTKKKALPGRRCGKGQTVRASILQKAEIRLINQTVCNQLLTEQLTPRMMCVGILTGGVDACQVKQHLGLVSRMFLAGVVSWGDGCAQRNKPGVYSRLTSLRDWIQEDRS
uniref:Peptidase S1 domain-containing protein n=1 Tax=Malurus cyaneus samueli TaxID=2593467 RepID=A0A8C5TTY8_9PASS